ncbi:MAG: hypothetical protein JOY54_20285 [Acidobacteriaceae bacterium]|nr:hypothetical protein [Acidobacteriaceae bacterium]
MKRFEFRLERALRVRRAQLQAAQVMLQQHLGNERGFRNLLAGTLDDRIAALRNLQDEDEIGYRELSALSVYVRSLHTRAAGLERDVEQTLQLIREQRNRVLALQREERLLTELRDKKKAEWEHQIDQEFEEVARQSRRRASYK